MVKSGITLFLTLRPVEGERGEDVRMREAVMADGKGLRGSFGSGSRESYDSADDYEDFQRALSRALDTAGDKSFEARLELRVR